MNECLTTPQHTTKKNKQKNIDWLLGVRKKCNEMVIKSKIEKYYKKIKNRLKRCAKIKVSQFSPVKILNKNKNVLSF